MKTCFFCGGNGSHDPLDKHHIFNGAYRNKSEKYGLFVYLCHHEHHIFGREAVHQNYEKMLELKKWGQRKAMREQGWTREEFIWEFGRNYLDENEPDFEAEEEDSFMLIEDEECWFAPAM